MTKDQTNLTLVSSNATGHSELVYRSILRHVAMLLMQQLYINVTRILKKLQLI